MIWEIDEDCDQAVNWQEFQAMYSRCSNDQAGGCSSINKVCLQFEHCQPNMNASEVPRTSFGLS